jgi:anthranilate phosphoribosyltransferase
VVNERQRSSGAGVVCRSQKIPKSPRAGLSAAWRERAGAASLKIQLACCLLATGEVLTLEQGLAKVAESW